MKMKDKTLKIVFSIALLYHVTIHGTRMMVPLYASELGASAFDIGLLVASFSIFSLLFAIHAGKLAERVGDRMPIFVGTLVTALGLGLPYFYFSMWALYISQILVGISQVFIHVSLQNVIGNAARDDQRDYYFSMLSTGMSVGQFVGPMMGGYVAEHFSYSIPFAVTMAIGIVPIGLSLLIPVIVNGERTLNQHDKRSSLDLLKLSGLRKAIFASALVLYSRDIYVTYFPLFASNHGISASQIGWILTLQGIAMVVVRSMIAPLTARFGREKVLVISAVLAGAAFIFIPLFGDLYLFALLAVLIGGGLGTGGPISMSMMFIASPEQRRGEALGLKMAVNRVILTIAPLFFGLVGAASGLASVFYVSGLFLVGGSFYTRGKKTTKEENQVLRS